MGELIMPIVLDSRFPDIRGLKNFALLFSAEETEATEGEIKLYLLTFPPLTQLSTLLKALVSRFPADGQLNPRDVFSGLLLELIFVNSPISYLGAGS